MHGHRVRIAQLGWDGHHPAESAEDVQVGIGIHWVEIDGHRFDAVLRARVVAAHDEITAGPTLVLQLIGPVEIVYVDSDGNEIGVPDLRGSTPTLQHNTIMEPTRLEAGTN